MSNNLISILTTENGTIVDTKSNQTISNINFSELAQINYNEKKILITGLINYIFYKLPIKFINSNLSMFVFEEWRLNSIIKLNGYQVNIKPELKDINNFLEQEQEIIFSLLLGYIQDKEITNFLAKWKRYSERHVKYNISLLHDKFQTSCRHHLIQAIKSHGLDRYIPASLYQPGIYDNIHDSMNFINYNENIIAC